MEHELDAELDYILKYRVLQTLYQPVLDSGSGRVFGYEALVRGPSNSPLHAPLPLIRAASKAGRLFELDLVCRELAIRRFRELDLPGRLFLNVSPSSLMEPTFRPGETLRLLNEVGLPPQQVVIELTEQQPLEDYAVLKAAVAHYTEAGFEIAIDDLGAGYAGLRLWSELRPCYVKIDHHFIESISTDAVKREFVRSIRGMAARLGCRVVAEGIESEDDYQAVQALGVNLHQGYHLGRPLASPLRDHPASRSTAEKRADAALEAVAVPRHFQALFRTEALSYAPGGGAILPRITSAKKGAGWRMKLRPAACLSRPPSPSRPLRPRSARSTSSPACSRRAPTPRSSPR